MLRPSGPAAREFMLFHLACKTMSVEKGHRIMKRTFFEEPPLDNPGRRVAGVGEVKCSAKAVTMSQLLVRDLEDKMMGSF